MSDADDISQLTTVECIKPDPFRWRLSARAHVVCEQRDYRGHASVRLPGSYDLT